MELTNRFDTGLFPALLRLPRQVSPTRSWTPGCSSVPFRRWASTRISRRVPALICGSSLVWALRPMTFCLLDNRKSSVSWWRNSPAAAHPTPTLLTDGSSRTITRRPAAPTLLGITDIPRGLMRAPIRIWIWNSATPTVSTML